MKVTSPQQLSAILRDVRLNQKLSQQAVADQIGILQNTVSSFERSAEKTKLETFFRILSALDLELEVRPRNAQDAGGQPPGEGAWKEEW